MKNIFLIFSSSFILVSRTYRYEYICVNSIRFQMIDTQQMF